MHELLKAPKLWTVGSCGPSEELFQFPPRKQRKQCRHDPSNTMSSGQPTHVPLPHLCSAEHEVLLLHGWRWFYLSTSVLHVCDTSCAWHIHGHGHPYLCVFTHMKTSDTYKYHNPHIPMQIGRDKAMYVNRLGRQKLEEDTNSMEPP